MRLGSFVAVVALSLCGMLVSSQEPEPPPPEPPAAAPEGGAEAAQPTTTAQSSAETDTGGTPKPGGEDTSSAPGNTTDNKDRTKSKKLKKPSFVPYCVTRDICKPACDCAIYDDCDILPMNIDVRNRILVALNQARSIQTRGEPQASGMPKLTYETNLEEISQCWAARCENEYSECFRTPLYNETTQTVGLLPLDLKATELPLDYWDRTIQIWLGEVRKTNAEVVSSLPAGSKGEAVHDYAQILAERILRVGCAWSRLVPTGSNKSPPSLIFVCTFAPRGPRQGEQIYTSGKACTTCRRGFSCDYQAPFELLCKEGVRARGRSGDLIDEEAVMERDEQAMLSSQEPLKAGRSAERVPKVTSPSTPTSASFAYIANACVVIPLLSVKLFLN